MAKLPVISGLKAVKAFSHKHKANVTGGTITCTEFTDANGRRYEDWFPAITFF